MSDFSPRGTMHAYTRIALNDIDASLSSLCSKHPTTDAIFKKARAFVAS